MTVPVKLFQEVEVRGRSVREIPKEGEIGAGRGGGEMEYQERRIPGYRTMLREQ